MSDEAKAVEEVAKTTSKVIDAAVTFGEFISKYIHGSLEQGMGIFEDKLKYMRWENQMRLMTKVDNFIKENNISAPNKAIPLKYAIPIFQYASLEDDSELQDMWAKLLVNAADYNSEIEIRREYISVLEELNSFDALILNKVYSVPYGEMLNKIAITTSLPEEIIIPPRNVSIGIPAVFENKKVLISLANLSRLGLILPCGEITGDNFYSQIKQTYLGRAFLDACTLKKESE